MGIESAKDVWDKLKTIHQSDGMARVRSLLGEIMRYRLVTTIDGTSALTRIQNEIGNLKAASRPSEDMNIEALLASLGPEYEFIVAGIDVSDTTKYEDVVAKLRKAEARLKGQRQGQGQNLANFTTTATTGSSNKKGRKKGSCFHCGKEGHHKKECKKLLPEQAKTDENDAGTQGSRTEGGKDNQDKARHSHWISPRSFILKTCARAALILRSACGSLASSTMSSTCSASINPRSLLTQTDGSAVVARNPCTLTRRLSADSIPGLTVLVHIALSRVDRLILLCPAHPAVVSYRFPPRARLPGRP